MIHCIVDVRLVGGHSRQGRLEVFYNGTWGTVCGGLWDLRDANVACRQLGFEGALKAEGFEAFGQGKGQIWMDDVQCIGNESSLTECQHRGWGVNNCGHKHDAGAVCIPGNQKYLYEIMLAGIKITSWPSF